MGGKKPFFKSNKETQIEEKISEKKNRKRGNEFSNQKVTHESLESLESCCF